MSVNPNENSTLVHDGITYRKVNRKAEVGEKVLITYMDTDTDCDVDFEIGDVCTVRESENRLDFVLTEEHGFEIFDWEYVVIEEVDTQPLELTESDVRNNPRQVIDLLANMALRLTELERKLDAEKRLSDEWAEEMTDRLTELSYANEQAINAVARNVETWAQEHENLKHELAKVNERTQPYQQFMVETVKAINKARPLTAEERREL
jgi:hypothetical protein